MQRVIVSRPGSTQEWVTEVHPSTPVWHLKVGAINHLGIQAKDLDDYFFYRDNHLVMDRVRIERVSVPGQPLFLRLRRMSSAMPAAKAPDKPVEPPKPLSRTKALLIALVLVGAFLAGVASYVFWPFG